MTWMQTYSGRKFSLRSPQVADIALVDIAHALSNQCRFNGHCLSFYSVAQHAVEVACCLADAGESPEVQFAGLHHDDSEAYLGDLIQPLKARDDFGFFRILEGGIQGLISRALGFASAYSIETRVKEADLRVLARERLDLLAQCAGDWECLRGVEPSESLIVPLPPGEAKDLYLSKHYELAAKCKRPAGADDTPEQAELREQLLSLHWHNITIGLTPARYFDGVKLIQPNEFLGGWWFGSRPGVEGIVPIPVDVLKIARSVIANRKAVQG